MDNNNTSAGFEYSPHFAEQYEENGTNFLPSSRKVFTYSVVTLLGVSFIVFLAWLLVNALEPDNPFMYFMFPYIIGYGGLWLFCKFYLVKRGYYGTPWHICSCPEEVNLNNYTLNGIGTTMKGSFGRVEGFFRSYQFFCFCFIPIIPLDCIVKSDNDGDGNSSTFRVVGTSRWHLLEVIVLMGRFWFFLFSGMLIYSFFE